jgi:predicted metallopeptidase
MSEFWTPDDKSITTVITDLIVKTHKHLADADFIVLFRDKAKKIQGTEAFASVYLVKGKYRMLLNADFILELAWDLWEQLNIKQRQAVIDHELCHCAIHQKYVTKEDHDTGKKTKELVNDVDEDGTPKYFLKPHDFQEFVSIIRQYGAWNDEISSAVKQLDLFKEAK